MPSARMRGAAVFFSVAAAVCPCVFGLNPSLDVSQYGHAAWTVQGGFSPGTTFAMAQTPDGYLWLGGEYGLFRFDGVRLTPWKPPGGQAFPDKPYSLLVTHDGTLWIGTFNSLAAWRGGKLVRYPELDSFFVTSLLEDHEGTVWAGALGTPTGRLCAIRGGSVNCYGQDGAFGTFVWSLNEDSSGTLWAGADAGLWRWKPGTPIRYPLPGKRIGDLTNTGDGRLLIGVRGAGLKQLDGGEFVPYPVQSAANAHALMPEREVNSNKLLRDRDGGIWIGTDQRGLIHVHQGRTDVFRKADGLSGDIIAGLFEDREGDIWVSTSGGFDRFRELAATTVSVQQGLSSERTNSVLAAKNGSIWVATASGLTRLNNGRITVFRKANGLPDDFVQSLFEDDNGRLWAFTARGLAFFTNERFVSADSGPSEEVYSITGDKAGNLWLSGNRGLSYLHNGHFLKNLPWPALGRRQQAKVILYRGGGLWLSFWDDPAVLYLKDGRVQASYKPADGLGKGPIAGLRVDEAGVVWAASQGGGVSRIGDGHIATLTTSNGLPCDVIHWTAEDDDRSLWLYTACGLVHITRSELDSWAADPKRRIQVTVLDVADGIMPLGAPSSFGPTFAKSRDGKLWFIPRGDLAAVDLRHPLGNRLVPPVHIESIVADDKSYDLRPGMRLPANVRNLRIEYTALSLIAPEKIHFKYKLEGQNRNWHEVVNERRAIYTNLAPRDYTFRVMAANNSGVWNDTGDSFEFSIAPAYYQTNWFRALMGASLLALLWAAYLFRVKLLQRESQQLRDVINTIPAYTWSARQDGAVDFINERWCEFSGLSAETALGWGWETVIHPADRDGFIAAWRAAVESGRPMEAEARVRRTDGQYRWLLIRNVPSRDKHGKIVKWYGTSTDIEDLKRAEVEREKLRQLEAELAHINRVSMMGELAVSVAHEVNQPLTGIVSNGSACLRWLDGDVPNLAEAREAVRDIVRDGKRAGEVIARIRALTKRTALPKENVDVNETVRDVLSLVGDQAKKNSVLIRTRLAEQSCHVLADRVQLQQVLLNLVMNGMEAMSTDSNGNRQVSIITREVDQTHVQVTVEDSGTGLDPGAISRIFEPFYTTKPGGMGMGLSISRSIVLNHGGRLWATANDGPGTSFHFTLPRYQGEGAHAGVAGE